MGHLVSEKRTPTLQTRTLMVEPQTYQPTIHQVWAGRLLLHRINHFPVPSTRTCPFANQPLWNYLTKDWSSNDAVVLQLGTIVWHSSFVFKWAPTVFPLCQTIRTLSVHKGTVTRVYMRQAFTFRDGAAVQSCSNFSFYSFFTSERIRSAGRHILIVSIMPYAKMASYMSNIYIGPHLRIAPRTHINSPFKPVHRPAVLQLHSLFSHFLPYHYRRKPCNTVPILYQLPPKHCWTVQQHYMHLLHRRGSALKHCFCLITEQL